MELEEYKTKLKELEDEFKKKKRELDMEFAISHSEAEVGEIFTDHIGSILVESRHISFDWNKLPNLTYYGLELKKDGTPKKSKSKRAAWQSNSIKNSKSEVVKTK